MKKLAHSRYLLPLEIFLGAFTFVIGVTGGYGAGALNVALRHLDMTSTWFVFFSGIGAGRVVISTTEWRKYRGAPESAVLQFVSARAAIAFACFMNWAGALAMVAAYGLLPQLLGILLFSLLMMVFNGWSFYENMMVRSTLNPKVHTPNLEYAERRV